MFKKIIASLASIALLSTSATAAEFRQYRNGSLYACATGNWVIRQLLSNKPMGILKPGECVEVIDSASNWRLVAGQQEVLVIGGKSGEVRVLRLNSKEADVLLSFEGDQ